MAPDWEQATVQAARFWGANWGKIFWQCELVRKTEVIRNVCCRCGKHFNGDGVECEPCRKIRAVEERNARAAEQRYWQKQFARESSKA